MKIILVLLLVLSTLFIGCMAGETTTEEKVDEEVTQEEALDEVDSGLISEDEELDIGEMI